MKKKIYFTLLIALLIVGCKDDSILNISDNSLLENNKNSLFGLSSNSNFSSESDVYYKVDFNHKTCSDTSSALVITSYIIESTKNATTQEIESDTLSKTLLNQGCPTAAPWQPDTSKYSLEQPKASLYHNTFTLNFWKIDAIENYNKGFLDANPDILVQLRSNWDASMGYISYDEAYVSGYIQYADEVVAAAMFRCLNELILGVTVSNMLISNLPQYGSYKSEYIRSKGYGYKFDTYYHDTYYPINLTDMGKYYGEKAMMNMY
ncbi:hypothetical protein ACR79M_17420 [Sphingobacterium spiritivorum]|uniref:hypothetical protein n=1 Tax=Sphingobacterium spiritivorum TaxID=258 RepID=UPI003DA4FA35